MNFLKKIYPEKKLPKGTFKPAILGKFQFGADNQNPLLMPDRSGRTITFQLGYKSRFKLAIA